MDFKYFVYQKRLKAGLTQQQCAEALGFEHRATFSKRENGKLDWSLNDLRNFAALLGCNASELLAEYEQAN